ncbi:transketolase [Euzebya rosea]|uniref:transketolase n=1 Tax=Euzebya rosea TaxID=2052804 RepID=UPI000D3E90D6|nr:transketolase [Euzebya rosea]
MTQEKVNLARKVREHCLEMTNRGKSSHVGSALGIVEILVQLYSDELSHWPKDPQAPERDRFIQSKGHAGAALYAVLAEFGYFPLDYLHRHYADGSLMSGHVSHVGLPGIEFSTGSLGHGLPVGVGMAHALRSTGQRPRVYVLMSDGECDEGTTWESALIAAHNGLGNLTAIIDYNKIQSLAAVAETVGLEPFAEKWRAFGWNVSEADGHDFNSLKAAFAEATPDRPNVILAHTTKGKGVSFMENSVLWHYRTPQGDEFEAALREVRQHA